MVDKVAPPKSVSTKFLSFSLLGSLLALALIVLPFLTSYYLATDILIFALLALGFNLLLGYAGILSFGQGAFFGIGAYAAGYVLQHSELNVWIVLLFAIVLTGAAALIVAFLSARSKSLYFVLLTLAFNQMVYFVALTWRSVTGGANGLRGFRRPDLELGLVSISLDSQLSFYLFTICLFLACLYVYLRIIHSPFGNILIALRNNENRLSAIGFHTKSYKILIFVVAGGISGLAGALYAFHWQLVPFTSVHLTQSANIAFMTLLGGIGYPFGPLIGAAIFTWLSDAVSNIWARWPLLFGTVIILIVLYLPGGLAGGWSVLRALVRRSSRRSQEPHDET